MEMNTAFKHNNNLFFGVLEHTETAKHAKALREHIEVYDQLNHIILNGSNSVDNIWLGYTTHCGIYIDCFDTNFWALDLVPIVYGLIVGEQW